MKLISLLKVFTVLLAITIFSSVSSKKMNLKNSLSSPMQVTNSDASIPKVSPTPTESPITKDAPKEVTKDNPSTTPVAQTPKLTKESAPKPESITTLGKDGLTSTTKTYIPIQQKNKDIKALWTTLFNDPTRAAVTCKDDDGSIGKKEDQMAEFEVIEKEQTMVLLI